ncbi:MAG: LytR/AlgR family response regulator transcription factor, partial [Bacteroidota bacterium]
MKYQCIIVDDEPIAQQILENYIQQIDALQLVSKCNNAFEALNVMHKEQIDIMFLDIKMPSLSGLDLIKTLKNP